MTRLGDGAMRMQPPVLRVWEVASGQEKWSIQGHNGKEVTAVAFSPDGKVLAAAVPFAEKIVLWDIDAGTEKATLKTEARPNRVVFTPDGKTLAAGMSDSTIILWDFPGK